MGEGMEGLGRERRGLGVVVLLDMDTTVRSFFPHGAARLRDVEKVDDA
jgi:hypothetical protein